MSSSFCDFFLARKTPFFFASDPFPCSPFLNFLFSSPIFHPHFKEKPFYKLWEPSNLSWRLDRGSARRAVTILPQIRSTRNIQGGRSALGAGAVCAQRSCGCKDAYGRAQPSACVGAHAALRGHVRSSRVAPLQAGHGHGRVTLLF